MTERDGKTVVLHSAGSWLAQTQIWMYNQVRHLPASVQSHIVCRSRQNTDQFALPNIHSFTETGKFVNFVDRLSRRLRLQRSLSDRFVGEVGRKVKPQVLHSNFGQYGWRDMPAARRLGSRHIVTFYGMDASQVPAADPRWRRRYRKLFQEAHCFLAEGPHLGRCLASLGAPPRKILVHHLGVCIQEIRFSPRRWQRGTPLRVLIAASFREKKGIPCALRALGELAKRLTLEITIIGDAAIRDQASLKEKTVILDTLGRENLGQKTRLLGYQPHTVLLEEAYRHHVFLSPSVTASDGDTEGGAPVTLIEMAATGMPVVATRHCDIPEVIRHPTEGLLATERNVPELVQLLWFLLEHVEAWPELGARARRHIELEFDAATQGTRLAAIYHGLVAGPAKEASWGARGVLDGVENAPQLAPGGGRPRQGK
jgi:colanic acid/amylovoran biosynthesis glycosyltransferase